MTRSAERARARPPSEIDGEIEREIGPFGEMTIRCWP